MYGGVFNRVSHIRVGTRGIQWCPFHKIGFDADEKELDKKEEGMVGDLVDERSTWTQKIF